ncbi:MAG: hypothetical protein WBB94_01625 [Candidatus Saccharimonadaceae bacterium]
MGNILQKAINLLTGDDWSPKTLLMPRKRPLNKLTERELLTLESEIGGKLFGPIPRGHRREFFCLDKDTWIWYEEWLDEKGKLQQSTTRYEVQAKGVLKVQEGARYNYIEGDELKNLVLAARMYYEQVARDIYKRDPHTGQKIA